MNAGTWCNFGMLLLVTLAANWSSAGAAEEFSIQRTLSAYLNNELGRVDYRSKLTDEECQRRTSRGKDDSACTYKYAQGAYANIVSSEGEGFFAFQLIMSTPEHEGHDIYRDTMFMYSLLIWGNLEHDKEYDDANEFLRRLWDSYVDNDMSEMVVDGWRYMIALEENCIGEFVQMVGVREASVLGPEDFLSPFAELCR